MRDRDNRKAAVREDGHAPARNPVEAAGGPLSPALMALQRSVGNGAVLEMLRRAGRPGAQEQQGHGEDRTVQTPLQRSAVHDVLRSRGRPLDEATRTDMETRFGADFSDVRIHDDSAARASAAEVQARAYTSDHHVVIGDGGADRLTLAPELTHVIQQREGSVAGTDNGARLQVSDPSYRFERSAEANARRIMAGPARAAGAPLPSGENSAAGPAGAARPAPAVQRLGVVGPGQFTAGRGPDARGEHFVSQEQSPTVVNGGRRIGGNNVIPEVVRFPTTLIDPAETKLRVADDHTLAVHDVLEPKEFYAVPKVVENANRALEQVGSVVRLVMGNLSVTIGGTVLHRVQPSLVQPAQIVTSEPFVSLLSSTCVSVASRLMGSRQDQNARAILGNGQRDFAIGARDHGDVKLTKLMGAIAVDDDQSMTVDQAVESAEFAHELFPDNMAESYGKAIRGGGRRQTAARLGVNEYATANVGEGYATYSNPAEDQLDHSVEPAVDRGEDVWRYHFAAVVAESLDGSCQVTLENYARNDFTTVLSEKLYDIVYDRAREKQGLFNRLPRRTGKETVETLPQNFDKLVRALTDDPKVAAAARPLLQSDFNEHTKQAWFFSAYGGRPGAEDSFHARQAGSGFFTNPLTVRVRKPDQS